MLGLSAGAPGMALPTVVATAEGQIGETPGPTDKLFGSRFESIRGQAGDLIFGGIFVEGGAMPPPPEVAFITDRIHGTSGPSEVGATASLFMHVDKVAPASAWSRNAANDGDFVAFSFAVDGSMVATMTVRLATFDESGTQMIDVPIATDVETFFVPDPTFAKTGVAVDNQGRATVTYTDFNAGAPKVRAVRVNASTGAIIDPVFDVSNTPHGLPEVALLDPAGNRLIVASSDFADIRGNIVDFTGPSPVVGTEFPINSTVPALFDINPVVAADPATGNFTVAWEDVSGVAGNPVDIRARRFDADGNPIGADFVVNTTTADAQGQPAAAYGSGGESVIVRAGDAASPVTDVLDVFAQAYDASGNPIGGEVTVNTTLTDVQDRPAVRFLPEQDVQGRPQFAVVWRDVGDLDGSSPSGTGTSYKCFAIDPDLEVPIFEDGFETGDTSSWSTTNENP